MNKKVINKCKNAMENKNILKAVVKGVYKDKELNVPVMLLDIKGAKAIIPVHEVDLRQKLKTLTGFIGREVYYIVIGVDEETGIITCSRKQAQEIQEDKVFEKIQDKEPFVGQVVNVLPYGAFVEIEGLVGFLKNSDFSTDFTSVKEIHKLGENIKVRFKEVSDSGKLLFESPVKYKSKEQVDINEFERGQIRLGFVKAIKPWGCYVNVAPGLDALCPVPIDLEIEEETRVSIKITKVDSEKRQVRGKIVKVL